MGTATRVWKEKEKFVVVWLHCTSSINHEIRHFHVEVVQGRQRNVQVRCDARRVVVLLLFDGFVPVTVVDAKAPFFLAPCVEVSWRSESTKTCRKCGSCDYPLLELLMQRFHAWLLIITTEKIFDLPLTLRNFYGHSVSWNLMFHGKIRTSKSINYRFFLDKDAL